MWYIADHLKIALIPNSDKSIPGYESSQELKSDFIQDEKRIISNRKKLSYNVFLYENLWVKCYDHFLKDYV
jgi:hypothetical protein